MLPYKENGGNADGVLGQPDFTSSTPSDHPEWDGPSVGLVQLIRAGGYGLRIFITTACCASKTPPLRETAATPTACWGRSTLSNGHLPAPSSGMSWPRAVSSDPSGRLYVADGDNNRILIFDEAAGLANGAAAAACSGSLTSPPAPSTPAAFPPLRLKTASGVFFDPTYNVLWAADIGNNRVLMYGAPSRRASLVLGQPGFTSRIWATSQAGMSTPSGVAVDPSTGKVFVADESNHRVLRFASVAALNSGAAAEAVLGQEDFLSSQPNRGWFSPSADTMSDPAGISIDLDGRLWVADSGNHRLLRFDKAAAKEDGADADSVLGQVNFTDDDFSVSKSRMDSPVDVAVDSGWPPVGVRWQ